MFRFGQPIKVNWAYQSSQREDTSGVYIVQCVYIVLYPQFFFFSKSLLKLFNVGMQVILIFLLVISALRLPMLHCLHAFLFTPVVRKLHFLVFESTFRPENNLTGPDFWLQRCKGYVGSEKWALKGFWVCFVPESAGIDIVIVNISF